MAAQPDYPYDVFISYNRADEDWVLDWLIPRLEEAGLRVATRHDTRIIGIPKIENTERAVDSSPRTIVVLTPAWLADEWNEFEALLVMGEDLAARRRKLLPLLLKPCTPPKGIDFREPADFTVERFWETESRRLARDILDVVPARAPWREPDGLRSLSHWRRWLRRYRWRVAGGTAAALLAWAALFTLLGLPPFQPRPVWLAESLRAEGAITLHNTGSALVVGSRNPRLGCTPPKGLWYRPLSSPTWRESEVQDELLCLEEFDRGPAWAAIDSLASYGDTVMALTNKSGILLSADNGAHFDARVPDFPVTITDEHGLNPHGLRLAPDGSAGPVLWVAGHEQGLLVYRTGQWTRLDGDEAAGCTGLPAGLITLSLAIDGDRVVIGTKRQGLWLSLDGGRSCRRVFDATGRYIFRDLWDISTTHPRTLALVQDTQMEHNDALGIWQLLDVCPRSGTCTDTGWRADQTQPLWHGRGPVEDLFVQQTPAGTFEWFLATETGQIWRDELGRHQVEKLATVWRCYIPTFCYARFAPSAPGQPPYLLAADRVYQYRPGPWWKRLWP